MSIQLYRLSLLLMRVLKWTSSLQMVSISILQQQQLSLYVYCSTVIVILHETKLTASAEEEQQELLRVLEQTKRMGYARDLQISMLESDGQLMLEKCEY